MIIRALFLLCVLCGSTPLAQSYRCDWSVVGSGGGETGGAAYRCGATAGQAAAGQITGATYWAYIGFWQADAQVGILEEEGPTRPEGLATRLEAIAPNPCPGRALVRYSLATEMGASVTVHDLAGRQVRVLASGVRTPGRYTAEWRGDDDAGRELANGVYFCRFAAGAVSATRKVILAR